MKTIKSLAAVLLLATMIFSCEKAADVAELPQKKASFTMDGITNALWESNCDRPYEITLFNIIDLGDGKYEWQWGVANLTGAPELTRISFSLPKCINYENPKFGFPNQLQQPADFTLGDDAYKRCRVFDHNKCEKLMNFSIPTRGTETTYFYLTMNSNALEVGTAYFRDASGNCGSTCFPGVKDACKAEKSCSFSQGRYFASPRKWAAPGTVTLGGHTYTEAEGRAIWRSSNRGGVSDAKKAFHQASAIKLSASTISSNASVWADVKIIEDWLATLPKLTVRNHYKFSNRAAARAAGRIGQWIDKNHCRD